MSGETGLLGMAVDPEFQDNHRVYLCQGGFLSGGGHDVHVTAWRLHLGERRVTKIKTLVGRLPHQQRAARRVPAADRPTTAPCWSAPATPRSGPTRATSRRTAGRRCGSTGSPGTRGPTTAGPTTPTRVKRYIHTWGHRNVQGLAQRSDGTLWSVEHGPDRDDEVNILRNGARLRVEPGARLQRVGPDDRPVPARPAGPAPAGSPASRRWRRAAPTGCPTAKSSGWGSYRGTLAVAALKAVAVLFMKFDGTGPPDSGSRCRRA